MKRRDFLKGSVAAATLPVIAKVGAGTATAALPEAVFSSDIEMPLWSEVGQSRKFALYLDGNELSTINYTLSFSFDADVLRAEIYCAAVSTIGLLEIGNRVYVQLVDYPVAKEFSGIVTHAEWCSGIDILSTVEFEVRRG